MSFIKDTFTSLPPWGKFILIAGGTFGIYKGGQLVYRKLNKPPGSEQIELAKTEAEKILKENKNLPPELQVKATFTPSQMKTFADKLFKAMDGAGTTDKDIKDVFGKLQNDLDVLYLIDAFGIRKDDNLTEWLQDDGATEYVNKILDTKAKITYRF